MIVLLILIIIYPSYIKGFAYQTTNKNSAFSVPMVKYWRSRGFSWACITEKKTQTASSHPMIVSKTSTKRGWRTSVLTAPRSAHVLTITPTV